MLFLGSRKYFQCFPALLGWGIHFYKSKIISVLWFHLCLCTKSISQGENYKQGCHFVLSHYTQLVLLIPLVFWGLPYLDD